MPSSLDALAQAFAKAFLPQISTAQTGVTAPRPQSASSAPRRDNSPNVCNFCGSADHFIRECGSVQDYINAGKIRCDVDGKVVLLTGAFVPCDISDHWLRDQVDEWHRQIQANSQLRHP
jgi:hypothetical protein